MCHMSGVRCQVSTVTLKKNKVDELVFGGSVINGAYPVYLKKENILPFRSSLSIEICQRAYYCKDFVLHCIPLSLLSAKKQFFLSDLAGTLLRSCQVWGQYITWSRGTDNAVNISSLQISGCSFPVIGQLPFLTFSNE